MAHGFPLRPFKPWRERIRHFSWVWFSVIMGTGIVSALFNNFPYGNGNRVLEWFGFAFFMINLVFFIFVCGCTIARYVMFPEVWGLMLAHPAQSLFIGCFPMGAATLINSGLAVNVNWGWGGNAFLYVLWGFWWLDSAVSYLIAFGMLYVMMIRQDHSLSKMTAIWLLPVVTLIVASSTGGLIAAVLRSHSVTLALLTTGFSFTMVLIGLSFALTTIAIYFLRLVTYGAPEVTMILSAFITLGPLGQGGFSLLVNGENLSQILPLHISGDFPFANQAGQMIYSGSFLGSYFLWSMGIAWIIIALYCIFSVVRKSKVPFSMAYWGMVFPHGTFALLSVQLAKVLNSGFFRAFGAVWSVVVLLLWIWMFVRSIPGFIDGSLFKAPYVPDANLQQHPSPSSIEKGGSGSDASGSDASGSDASGVTELPKDK